MAGVKFRALHGADYGRRQRNLVVSSHSPRHKVDSGRLALPHLVRVPHLVLTGEVIHRRCEGAGISLMLWCWEADHVY